MNDQPRLIPMLLEQGLEELVTGPHGHIDQSFRVYNVGRINTAEVLSGEYFVPVRDALVAQTVERLIGIVADNGRHGVYQTSPLSLRFVKGTQAYMSMVQGSGVFCAVEVPIFTQGVGAFEALLSYEQGLYSLGARPHWGQMHELTGTTGWWRSAYPQADRWHRVYRELNPLGIFDNHFTDRLGLSVAES
jgi:hypothetical protein